MIRNPAVAGQFYPGEREVLLRELDELMGRGAGVKEEVVGMVMPHAGYMYSGPVAASVIGSAAPKQNYIIIGPNHTGLGSPFSISASDSWKTPLGNVKLNMELVKKILKDCPQIRIDELAQIHEHSIEVQLPFLQKACGNFSFVPIVVYPSDLPTYRKIGEALAASIKELSIEKETSIMASSDMTHYESQESAEEKDRKVIDAILNLDEKALVERVKKFNISMCGFAPCAIMIAAAKKMGASKARLVKYQTSGDVTRDRGSVVGYAGIIIN